MHPLKRFPALSSRPSKRTLGLALLAVWVLIGCWQVSKPMPDGTDISMPLMSSDEVRFLHDVTYPDAAGQARHEQQIFDEVLRIIDGAQRFVVVDFFLFNDMMGASAAVHRPLSSELAERLIARKRATPELPILLITDPINDVYGGAPSALLNRLRANGIDVVLTDLDALRDSNPAYSALWRTLLQWMGNASEGGWLPNPFGDLQADERITLRSWLALLNFKANHRKVIIADRADGQYQALVTSANPHDASSGHSNVALTFTGRMAETAFASELGIAYFSGWQGVLPLKRRPQGPRVDAARNGAPAQLQLLTEQGIRQHLLATFEQCRAGDAIDIAMFYLSDRKIIAALLAAADRGVQVRLILDPNRDAFGRQKDGVPNRPVANELVTASDGRIQIRWYRTEGEQFHTKLTLVRRGADIVVSLGSANLTRRNLGNYNLEANMGLVTAADSALGQQFITYFDRLWGNEDAEYTSDFSAWRDTSRWRYWRYRFMEATGLSTF